MRFFVLFLVISFSVFGQQNTDLNNFSNEFFTWRSAQQPASSDDIPRVERPEMWTPDWSPEALIKYNDYYHSSTEELEALDKSKWSRSDSVDYLCLRSAIERVNWELNVLKSPYNNPDFYVHQTLGTLFELLLISSPIDDNRIENITLRLNSFSKTIDNAKKNLTSPVQSFTKIALNNLNEIKNKLDATETALLKVCSKSLQNNLSSSFKSASEALTGYAEWLNTKYETMPASFNVGREGYEYYLKKIALMPYTPEELLLMGKMEWDRSIAFDHFAKMTNEGLPELPVFKTIEDQIKQEAADEISIREFLVENKIMCVPDWIQHYINAPFPEHLEPLAYMGVTDDLTSKSRLNEDGVKYIIPPAPKMPFFWLSMAKDPRGIIIHEGVPGHYFQLVRSWANPNFTRQHFIDPGANEGIGFYVEEMMLQQGALEDKPKSTEMIYSYMRLRAFRVDVDVNLALGNYTVEQAAKYLSETVPMDYKTALDETGFFAYNPGQAISYQIGKIQIMNFLSDAKVRLREDFDLVKFHDYLIINGNVPIALLRWEYLGLDDQIKKLW